MVTWKIIEIKIIYISRSLSSESQSSNKNCVIFPLRDTGDKEQMILDAGQKKYGQVECPGCQCVYDPDDRSDVEHHLQYHNRNKISLKYLVIISRSIIADILINICCCSSLSGLEK